MPRLYHSVDKCPSPLQVDVKVDGHIVYAGKTCSGHDAISKWNLEELRQAWATCRKEAWLRDNEDYEFAVGALFTFLEEQGE